MLASLPTSMKPIPVIPIDLALPPKQRWQNVPKPVITAALRLTKKQKAMDPTGGFLSLGLRAITQAVNPYRDDISAWAKLLGVNVGDLLIGNFSYELSMAAHAGGEWLDDLEERYPLIGAIKERLGFACTSGAVWIEGEGMVHLRTLDWCFPGLGKRHFDVLNGWNELV